MLERYGWSDALREHFKPHRAAGLSPGRVVMQQRGQHRLITEEGELDATLAGKFVHEAASGGFPVVGDWVAAALRAREGSATVRALLPRSSVFVRRASGPAGGVQAVAANIDVALIVTSLNGELNPRRLERYLAAVREGGARPVIVLTKADLAGDAPDALQQVEAVAEGAAVHAISALTGAGMDGLARELVPGATAVLLGSSGVGKSTLVNALAGAARMATQAIREDDAHGRHTTTHRELVLLPGGSLLIDTPGMRELGLWEADEGVAATFSDVEALAGACRFTDCRHRGEPGCAIREAIGAGTLALSRWESYEKLQRELAFESRKEDPLARAAARKVWIRRHKEGRAKKKWDEEA
ncbi:MAG TPA: ribosome small subunit-dependent GTPase A [Rhizomicrobium sp.]|nr:ribosome small subunit-dependent GTPase A [Rhizomicrobium sp.]